MKLVFTFIFLSAIFGLAAGKLNKVLSARELGPKYFQPSLAFKGKILEHGRLASARLLLAVYYLEDRGKGQERVDIPLAKAKVLPNFYLRASPILRRENLTSIYVRGSSVVFEGRRSIEQGFTFPTAPGKEDVLETTLHLKNREKDSEEEDALKNREKELEEDALRNSKKDIFLTLQGRITENGSPVPAKLDVDVEVVRQNKTVRLLSYYSPSDYDLRLYDGILNDDFLTSNVILHVQALSSPRTIATYRFVPNEFNSGVLVKDFEVGTTDHQEDE